MRLRIIAAGLAATVIACGESAPSGPPPLLTSLPRELTSDERSIQQAANSFTFKLLSRLSAAEPQKNIFVSPLSVSFALGMALNGAVDETRDELVDGLKLDGLSDARINEGYRGLMELLSSLDPDVQMDVANSLWYSNAYTVQPTLASTLSQYFDASANARDFASPSTLADINSWVNAQTQGKIPTILDQISPDEIMFLVNAMYFRGSWRDPFNPSQTQTAPFHLEGGGQGTAQMMFKDSDQIAQYHSQTVMAARLTYGNGAFAAAFIRPSTGQTIGEFAAGFGPTQWDTIREGFNTGRAILRIPRLKLDYKRSLKPDLQALGINRPFNESAAQFPRLVTEPVQLVLSRVEHKAAIELDERGTTAAAATAVGVGVVSAPPQLDFDRPFLYLIYEQFSGTILFAGIFADPSPQG